MGKAKQERHAGPLSKALRERIATRQLTSYRVAKLSGVSVDSVLRWHSGERGLSLDTADAMAKGLGLVVTLDPDWSY